MRKIRKYKGLSLFLAFMFFANTMSFSMDFHLCKGEVYSFSLFGKAESCDMSSTTQKAEGHECCKKHKKSKIQQSELRDRNIEQRLEDGCCSNEHLTKDSLQDFNRTELNLSKVDQYQVFCVLYTYFFSLQETEDVEVFLSPPLPPSLSGKELSVLYQVFLI